MCKYKIVWLCKKKQEGDYYIIDCRTVHRNKFLFNKTNKTHEFPKFYFVKNSTCFGHFLCPSSGDFYCTFDIGIFLAGVMTASKQVQDGTNVECRVENS